MEQVRHDLLRGKPSFAFQDSLLPSTCYVWSFHALLTPRTSDVLSLFICFGRSFSWMIIDIIFHLLIIIDLYLSVLLM